MPTDASPTGHIRRPSLQAVALIAAAGLFFALTSPFNAVTYLPLAARWSYWSALIGITALTYVAVRRLGGPKWQRAGVVSVVATPLVFITIVLVQIAIGHPVPRAAWVSLSFSIWVINAALAALAAALFETASATAKETPTAQATAPDPAAGIRQRLPEPVRDEAILALNAQDHYLAIVLASGQHLVHMRLSDAMAMLSAHDGLQVHRSWWVARAAVERIARDGRRLELVLTSGQRVPVSRSGAARLKHSGWLV